MTAFPTKRPLPSGGALPRGGILHQVLALALWPFLQQLLGFLVGFIDLLIATRLGEECGDQSVLLESVAVGGFMTWFLMIMLYSVGTGIGAFISRATGQKKTQLVKEATQQSLLIGAGAGILSMLLCWLLLPIMMAWFHLNHQVQELTTRYVLILSLSCCPAGMIIALSAALRGNGNTRTPFMIMLIVNLINITVSALLGFGFSLSESLSLPPLGVLGLAFGSVIGWSGGCLLLLLWLKKMRPAEQSSAHKCLLPLFSSLALKWPIVKPILSISWPHFLEISAIWCIHSICVKMVSHLSEAGINGAMGAHIMVIRLEALSLLPGFAIGSAGAILAGQYLGAGTPKLAIKAINTSWILALFLMSAIGALFLTYPEQLLLFISPERGIEVTLAIPLLFICGLIQPFSATTLILKSSLRGVGSTKLVFRYSFISMLLIRALFLPFAVLHLQAGLAEIWKIMALDLMIQAGIFSTIYRKRLWLKDNRNPLQEKTPTLSI